MNYENNAVIIEDDYFRFMTHQYLLSHFDLYEKSKGISVERVDCKSIMRHERLSDQN